MNKDIVQGWFSYHRPPNYAVSSAHDAVREMFLNVALRLNEILPEGDDKVQALQGLRHAMYAANACLACNATPHYPNDLRSS